jgi:hypothetical protein
MTFYSTHGHQIFNLFPKIKELCHALPTELARLSEHFIYIDEKILIAW